MTVPIKIQLTGRGKKGFILIQEITLCKDHDMLRKMALTDSHHEKTGALKNNQKPCHMPRISYKS